MNFRNSVLGVQISILYSIDATFLRLMFSRFKCMTLYSTQMLRYMIQFVSLILLDFSLSVKAATLIFISGCGLAISSAKEGKSGFIYNLVKS